MFLKKRCRIHAAGLIALALFPTIVLSEDLSIKVIVYTASVRLEPSPDSKIIDQVAQDTILQVQAKEGDWYYVKLEPDENGFEKAGYIHKSIVVELADQSPEREASSPAEAAAAVQKERPQEQQDFLLEAVDESVLTDEKDLAHLEKTADKMRRQSIAFLTLVKKMKPVKVESTKSRSVEMVRVIIDGCRVFEAMDEGSRVIFTPRINDEFEFLEKNDGFYRIQLPDGRDGWIREQCIQIFTSHKEEAVIEFQGVKTKEVNAFINVAEQIFSRMVQDKTVADQIIDKYKDEPTGRLYGSREIHRIYADIDKYFDYACRFYEDYIRNRGILEVGAESFLSHLSAWSEIIFGSTSFQTEYLTDPLEQNKGMVRDISLGGNLTLSDSSAVHIQFSDKKDIIQTPYGSTAVEAGYRFHSGSRLGFDAGINFNRYNDELNERNDFNRMQLRGSADYRLTPAAGLSFDYTYLNNGYTSGPDNSYGSHLLAAGLDLRSSSRSRFLFFLRSRFQSSTSQIHDLSDVQPSITYERRGEGKLLNLNLKYQHLDFSEIDLKDYSMATLSLSSRSSGLAATSMIDLALTSKNFSQNELLSYVQVRSRYSRSGAGMPGAYFTASAYTNFYQNYPSTNLSDIRVDIGKNGHAFFGNISTSFRIWHRPGVEAEGPVKPHVVDIYAKLGIRHKNFRIGPSFGTHALLSSEGGNGFLERDGNLIRFGGFAEGMLNLPKNINLRIFGAYEYGMVYTETIAINTATGEFDTGDLLQRHPATLQINADLNAPLLFNFELVGRASYYKINTDMDASMSINPVINNTRFILVFGMRYRYN
jgi:uncharacterized protein YgiM (DUF1202 family)